MRYLTTTVILVICIAARGQEADTGFVGFNSGPATNIKTGSAIIKMGIVPVFFGQVVGTGELRITYEQVIAEKQSVTAGFSYDYPNLLGAMLYAANASGGRGANGTFAGYGSSPGILDANYSFEGVRATLGYRYYLLKSKKAPKGIYVGPYLSYNFLAVHVKDARQNFENLHYFNACGVFGFQALSRKHFTFDMMVGLGYKYNYITHVDANMDLSPQSINIPAFNHVKFLAQLNFGYHF